MCNLDDYGISLKEANNFSGPPNSNTQGTKMERLYAELSEYYVFDKAKYTLEEFFGDIKTFKDQFKQVRSIHSKIYLIRKILLGLRFNAERERG